MKLARKTLAAVFAAVVLAGTATPAAAAPLSFDSSRSDQFCITFHSAGIFDPIRVCIPLI